MLTLLTVVYKFLDNTRKSRNYGNLLSKTHFPKIAVRTDKYRNCEGFWSFSWLKSYKSYHLKDVDTPYSKMFLWLTQEISSI